MTILYLFRLNNLKVIKQTIPYEVCNGSKAILKSGKKSDHVEIFPPGKVRDTLDKDSFPEGLIGDLIQFHKFRIKNYQRALKKILHLEYALGDKNGKK